jgi:hypothetical protein
LTIKKLLKVGKHKESTSQILCFLMRRKQVDVLGGSRCGIPEARVSVKRDPIHSQKGPNT